MNERVAPPSSAGYRFPSAIIGHAVRRYSRIALSCRDVEELLAERGVIVSYETIRQWCRKFGQAYANALRRRLSWLPSPSAVRSWHSLVSTARSPTGWSNRLMQSSDTRCSTIDKRRLELYS